MASKSATKPLINLMKGWPSPSLLPTALLKQVTSDVLSNPSVSNPGLLYGPDEGYMPLRENVARWLTDFYRPADPVGADRITISGGASQNIACILQVFSDPVYTRNVWLVAPCYMLVFRIFLDSGFHGKLRAVPEDEEGIDIEFLRREIALSEKKAKAAHNDEATLKPVRPYSKIYKHVIYAVPTFSNPSSRTMSLRRRKELVRVAREFDALIITDDVYDLLQWPAKKSSLALHKSLKHPVLPRVLDIDRYLDGGAERPGADGFGNAASNGSFSKILAPGLRTGWVEGTKKLARGVSQTGTSASGGAPSQLSATFVSTCLANGTLEERIYNTLQPAYSARYHAMISAVEKYLIPVGVTLPQTDREVVGGYFMWVSVQPPLKGAEVARRAKEEENLIVAQGEIFQVPGDERLEGNTAFPHALRLCFAWEDEEKLEEGVQRLADVIKRLQAEMGGKGWERRDNGTSSPDGAM